MRFVLFFLLPMGLAGCDAEAEPDCDTVVDGRYYAATGFGMPMDVDLSFDEATCEFTATDWSAPGNPGLPMSHSDRMLGGTVDGEIVHLYGTTDYWSSCPGEVLEGGTQIAGHCADGTAYELTLRD